MTPYEIAIGLRYTRARRGSGRNRFIPFISATSMAGIALGVAALIVVLSVMNGFQEELRNRILSVASHIEIRGLPVLADPAEVTRIARTAPRVKAAAPYVLGQAMLSAGAVNRGALVRGIDPALEDGVADIGRHMRSGSLAALKPGEFGIVLGAELARALGARMGDPVVVVVPQGSVTAAGTLPRLKTFRLVGVFEVGMFEFDNGLALINIDDAREALPARRRLRRAAQGRRSVRGARGGAGDRGRHAAGGRGPRLDVSPRQLLPRRADREADDVHHPDADRRRRRLQHRVGAGDDRHRQAGRHRDPAHARRVARASIMAIFIVQGALIGAIGTAIGVAAGVALAKNVDVVVPAIERMFNVQFLDKSVYYISDLPSDLQRADVLGIAGIALALALAATLYPAWRAARVNPAEALRYE